MSPLVLCSARTDFFPDNPFMISVFLCLFVFQYFLGGGVGRGGGEGLGEASSRWCRFATIGVRQEITNQRGVGATTSFLVPASIALYSLLVCCCF